MNLSVDFYVTASGKVPYQEWISRLRDKTAKAAITRRMIRIRIGDLGDHRSLGDGVSELRIDVGPGYRVYYGVSGRTVVLFLAGGAKGTQTRDIARAKLYWHDFLNRHGNHH